MAGPCRRGQAVSSAEIIEAGAISLPEIADSINDKVAATEQHARSAAQGAIEIGALLAEAKKQIAHGEFETWVKVNTTLAPRTARAYMRLAIKIPALPEAERQRVAGMPVRQAIAAITTDPTPPPSSSWSHAVRHSSLDDRERAVVKLKKTAGGIREATKLLAIGVGLPPAKIASLRSALTGALEELDLLQQGGGA